MNKEQLIANIKKNRSVLCVGLDFDPKLTPTEFLKNPEWLLDYGIKIIDAIAPYCVAFKPNLAFYETEGGKGMYILQDLLRYIRSQYPDKFIIADAKRGDIGNTSEKYARAWLWQHPFDAITVAPYMGEDSVKPFLMNGKWVCLLALTSNKGSKDFQMQKLENGRFLYEEVLIKSQEWAGSDQMMYVVGATNGELIENVRSLAPEHIFLVPGVGAQGGTIKDVFDYGVTPDGLVLINSSRKIIHASKDKNDCIEAAAQEAKRNQEEMAEYLSKKGII